MQSIAKILVVLSVSPALAHPALAKQNSATKLESVLNFAKLDALELNATGTVCEGIGIHAHRSAIQCGVTGLRQEDSKKVWTTRCFVLCANGNFEQGNFCKFDDEAVISYEKRYCDR